MDDNFQEFLAECKEQLPDSKKGMVKLIKKRYREADEDYLLSEDFANLLNNVRQRIVTDNERFFVHLREFLNTLKNEKALSGNLVDDQLEPVRKRARVQDSDDCSGVESGETSKAYTRLFEDSEVASSISESESELGRKDRISNIIQGLHVEIESRDTDSAEGHVQTEYKSDVERDESSNDIRKKFKDSDVSDNDSMSELPSVLEVHDQTFGESSVKVSSDNEENQSGDEMCSADEPTKLYPENPDSPQENDLDDLESTKDCEEFKQVYDSESSQDKNYEEKQMHLLEGTDGIIDKNETQVKKRKRICSSSDSNSIDSGEERLVRGKCRKKYAISVGRSTCSSPKSFNPASSNYDKHLSPKKKSAKKKSPDKGSPRKIKDIPVVIITDSESSSECDLSKETFYKKLSEKYDKKKLTDSQHSSGKKKSKTREETKDKNKFLFKERFMNEDVDDSTDDNHSHKLKEKNECVAVTEDLETEFRKKRVELKPVSASDGKSIDNNRTLFSNHVKKVKENQEISNEDSSSEAGPSGAAFVTTTEKNQEPVSGSCLEPVGNTEVKKKGSSRQIKKLEELMQKISNRIEELRRKELDLDDLDNETSDYLLEDKLQRKFMKVWEKLCELHKASNITGRHTEKYFRYQGTRYPVINRKIEKLINKNKIFPDYHDIREIISNVNKSKRLHLRVRDIDDLAREAFTDVGNKLQDRRQKDLASTFKRDSIYDSNDDSALYDLELHRKLEANRKVGKTKMEEVVQKYVHLQMVNRDADDDEEDDDDEEEEDAEEEDVGEENMEEMEIDVAFTSSMVDNSDSEYDEFERNLSSPCLEIENIESGNMTVIDPDRPADLDRFRKSEGVQADEEEGSFAAMLGLKAVEHERADSLNKEHTINENSGDASDEAGRKESQTEPEVITLDEIENELDVIPTLDVTERKIHVRHKDQNVIESGVKEKQTHVEQTEPEVIALDIEDTEFHVKDTLDLKERNIHTRHNSQNVIESGVKEKQTHVTLTEPEVIALDVEDTELDVKDTLERKIQVKHKDKKFIESGVKEKQTHSKETEPEVIALDLEDDEIDVKDTLKEKKIHLGHKDKKIVESSVKEKQTHMKQTEPEVIALDLEDTELDVKDTLNFKGEKVHLVHTEKKVTKSCLKEKQTHEKQTEPEVIALDEDDTELEVKDTLDLKVREKHIQQVKQEKHETHGKRTIKVQDSSHNSGNNLHDQVACAEGDDDVIIIEDNKSVDINPHSKVSESKLADEGADVEANLQEIGRRKHTDIVKEPEISKSKNTESISDETKLITAKSSGTASATGIHESSNDMACLDESSRESDSEESDILIPLLTKEDPQVSEESVPISEESIPSELEDDLLAVSETPADIADKAFGPTSDKSEAGQNANNLSNKKDTDIEGSLSSDDEEDVSHSCSKISKNGIINSKHNELLYNSTQGTHDKLEIAQCKKLDIKSDSNTDTKNTVNSDCNVDMESKESSLEDENMEEELVHELEINTYGSSVSDIFLDDTLVDDLSPSDNVEEGTKENGVESDEVVGEINEVASSETDDGETNRTDAATGNTNDTCHDHMTKHPSNNSIIQNTVDEKVDDDDLQITNTSIFGSSHVSSMTYKLKHPSVKDNLMKLEKAAHNKIKVYPVVKHKPKTEPLWLEEDANADLIEKYKEPVTSELETQEDVIVLSD